MGNTKTEIEKGLEARGYKLLSVLDDGLAKKGFRSLYKDGRFIVRVKLGNGKIEFNGKKYTDADTLLDAVVSYTNTLEYPTETYDPDMPEKCKEEMRLEHTFGNFGFEETGYGIDGCNYKADGVLGTVYGRIVNGNSLVVGDRGWINLYDEEGSSDEKCRSARSTLYALYAANIAKMCSILKKSGELSKLTKIELNEFDDETLTAKTKNMAGEILAVLKNAVEMLENE